MLKILKGFALVLSIAAVAGIGTYAIYQDKEETSTISTEAGTLDLVLGEEASLPIEITNAYPGMVTSRTITVENKGSLGGYLRAVVDQTNLVNEENGIGEPEEEDGDTTANSGELCNELLFTVKDVDSGKFLVADASDNPVSFQNTESRLNGNADLPANSKSTLEITLYVNKYATNKIQSDKCGANFIISLIQDVDQDGIGDEEDTIF